MVEVKECSQDSKMELIESFTVNHLDLMPGVYVSRRDFDENTGSVVTTFDIRVCAPNKDQVLSTGVIHTLEHLGATFLRNHVIWKNKVIYFGPMGCRTGFYLVLFGRYVPGDVRDLLVVMFDFCAYFQGEIPGATLRECGNYSDQDLDGAKTCARKYLEEVLTSATGWREVYPA